MKQILRRRLREAVPSAVLAAVIFLPLFLTRPGRVGADTKTYLYLDPGRMLARAPEMWDRHIGLGTVTHQNIGYLWPIGPFYWFTDLIGLPDWFAQRIWLGLILFFAGLGVRFMLKAMGQVGPHVTAATFVYALTPYVLTLASRLSVILLPYAGLPWLIGLTVLALRNKRWREPALFALVVATIGSVNATALILCCVGPVLWMAYEVFVTRQERFRDAITTGLRISVLTIACSLWWLAGLWAQGGYGIEILRYTETARTVAASSIALEVLRGFGYWFFYGNDRYGSWVAPSRWYTTIVPVLGLSYLLPLLGLIGASVARFRERAFFLLLLVAGLLLAVGGHPWNHGPPAVATIQSALESDAGLSMRSLPRAAPLVVLALAVFIGALIQSIAARRERLARPLTAAIMVIAVLNLSPLWTGRMVDRNLDRPETIPTYWQDAAAFLDDQGHSTRVLEIPGSDFASYRWGNTVDPILPGLMDRAYVARELIPYGSPASADLLNSFDRRLQELTFEPTSLAPIARLMGVGDVSVRNDLTYERYNTPRPRNLWQQLLLAPGTEVAAEFGPGLPNTPRPNLSLQDEQELTTSPDLPNPPEVGVLSIDDPEAIVRTAPLENPLIVAGSGDGLVDLAAGGLISGHEHVLYAGSYHDKAEALATEADRDATLVLTDSNRRRGTRWGTIRDTNGLTERADDTPMVNDPSDQRLDVFGTDDPATQSVTVDRGAVRTRATSYGNVVSFTPEDAPDRAIDGDPNTSWRTGGFSNVEGDKLELTFREPVTTDHIRVVQAMGGVRNRTITKVSLSFDGEKGIPFDLDNASRPEEIASDDLAPGQSLDFPTRTFSKLTIDITGTNPSNLRRFEGISGVGFGEIIIDSNGKRLHADPAVRLPTNLLDAVGTDSLNQPLVIALTRLRSPGVIAVRSSPESRLVREFELPTARSFGFEADVRLSDAAIADTVIDRALGLPNAEAGGVTATSSRRLPGSITNRSMAAIDGDPDTWWSPGFLDQHGDFLNFRTAKPVTVSTFDLTVLNDGRHSVPRMLEIAVSDGSGEPQREVVTLPEIQDQKEPNGRITVPVRLTKPLTGTDITVTIPREPIESVRDVWTPDYFSDELVPMPVGIVDLGIDGLEAPELPAKVDSRCRTDLLSIDGTPVPLSLSGSTADLLAGKTIDVTLCDDADLHFDKGTGELTTGTGALTGFDIDRVVLRSAAGGKADLSSGLLQPDAGPDDGRPSIETTHSGASSLDVSVASADKPFWLVLGESHNLGWKATANGKDLGEPVLVDGYANGWQVPAGSDIDIHLEWTPQRVVNAMLWASVLAVLVTLFLALRPRGALAAPADAVVPLDTDPSMPQALNRHRFLRYAGPVPGRFAKIATPIAAALFGFLVIGPVPGVVLTLVALAAMHFPKVRPVLTIGPAVIFALCVGFICARQVIRPLPSGFDWPSYFEIVHQPAWTAVALLALDVVVDRCWLRRWWPSSDSPD